MGSEPAAAQQQEPAGAPRSGLPALALAALGVVYGDIGTSPLYTLKEVFASTHHPLPGMSKEDIEHFFASLVQNLNSCIHINVRYGENDHHKIEAAIKSLAVALRIAASVDKKQKGIPSTKGSM